MSESNYHTTVFFSENLLATKMWKTQILMNKPVYLGLSTLELSKIVMHKFLYDCVKPKHGGKAELCYMDADNFFAYIKTDDFYKDIAKDDETRSDFSNYELDHYQKEKIKEWLY